MAKKNASGRKLSEDSSSDVESTPDEQNEVSATETVGKVKTPPAKSARAKPPEVSVPGNNIGLGDIRKAVAFANSVGGLDSAIALLQIVKVAKEVQ
jgi:hypothetical protein